MVLTTAQLTILKADILADPVLNAQPNNSDGAFAIAEAYNLTAVPDYWVFRTSVTQSEYVGTTTPEATTFSWPQYIARSQAERDGWREMFADGGFGNPSRPNVRQGFQDIFSGATAPPVAQRAHLANVSRRKATRAEKLLIVAGGLGTTASPSTMAFEGALTYQDVLAARTLP